MKSLKFWIIGLAALLITAVVGIVALKKWKNSVIAQQEQRAKQKVQALIANGEFETAWQAVQHLPFANDADWLTIRQQALIGRRNINDLLAEYRRQPDLLKANETASLLLARAFIHQKETSSFAILRDHWTTRDHNTNQWNALLVDQQLLSGNTAQVWEQLADTNNDAELTAQQLIQRALIKGATNAVAALADLDRAVALDSKSAEARSFRGQVLENLGDKQLARLDYGAAHLAAPNNPLWRDQLAEFYRRHQQFDFALSTWAPGQTDKTPDFIWLKSAFWARVAVPHTFPEVVLPANEPLSALAEFILGLPPERFWNEDQFDSLALKEPYEKTRQEVYWLRILQFLLTDHEAKALETLNSHPFRHGLWDVYLHETLSSILRYRQSGRFSPPGTQAVGKLNQTASRHVLIQRIKEFQTQERIDGIQAQVSDSLASLLSGPNAFAAAFLSSGWRRAAMTLFHSDAAEQAQAPSWFHYGIAQLKRFDESPASALAYLAQHNKATDTQLLQAELLIGLGRFPEARPILQQLAPHSTAEGVRAAWLLAIDLLQNSQYAEAKQWIAANPNLGKTTRGRELSGKLAELTDNLPEATAIYQELAAESPQAMRFLADQAFKAGNLAVAREHTLNLLQENPSDLNIMANLRAIDNALAASE